MPSITGVVHVVDEQVRRADCGAGHVKSCLVAHGKVPAKPTSVAPSDALEDGGDRGGLVGLDGVEEGAAHDLDVAGEHPLPLRSPSA